MEESKQVEESKVEEKIETPTTVKVGEKEYSQEELSKLVGLGETAKELETQWNRPIDKLYPDYTQKSQRLAELEKKEAEREQADLQAKAQAGNLSPEEARRIALEEASNIGLMRKDEFSVEVNRAVANALAAKDLLDDANVVLTEAEEKGQPKTTVDNLLRFMEESGVRKPETAYKLLFEKELDAWKENQLTKIKQPGLDTQTGSQAGSKQPEKPEPITSRDALSAAVAARIRQGAGMERG